MAGIPRERAEGEGERIFDARTRPDSATNPSDPDLTRMVRAQTSGASKADRHPSVDRGNGGLEQGVDGGGETRTVENVARLAKSAGIDLRIVSTIPPIQHRIGAVSPDRPDPSAIPPTAAARNVDAGAAASAASDTDPAADTDGVIRARSHAPHLGVAFPTEPAPSNPIVAMNAAATAAHIVGFLVESGATILEANRSVVRASMAPRFDQPSRIRLLRRNRRHDADDAHEAVAISFRSTPEGTVVSVNGHGHAIASIVSSAIDAAARLASDALTATANAAATSIGSPGIGGPRG